MLFHIIAAQICVKADYKFFFLTCEYDIYRVNVGQRLPSLFQSLLKAYLDVLKMKDYRKC